MKKTERNISMGRLLSFAISIAPGTFILMFAVRILRCTIALLGVYLTRSVFTSITAAAGGKETDLAVVLLLYGFYLFLNYSFSFFFTRYVVQFKLLPSFERKMLEKLHSKTEKISSEHMESHEMERLIRLTDSSRQQLFRFVEIVINLVVGLIQTLLITFAVSAFSPWFVIFLPLALAAVLVKNLNQAKLVRRTIDETQQREREEEEFEKAMLDTCACKESRVCGALPLLASKWRQSRDRRDCISRSVARRMFLVGNCLVPVEIAGDCAGLVLSAILLMKGLVTFPVFTAAVAAYVKCFPALRSFFRCGAMRRYSVQG